MKISVSIRSKRQGIDHSSHSSVLPRKKHRVEVINTASIYVKPLELPLVSTTTGSSSESIHLEPYKPYTIGRNRKHCDAVFEDRRVSKRHCQILFDALNRKIYAVDGVFWFGSGGCSRIRVSLNGVFVNGVRLARGEVAELGAGDEVVFACGNEERCSLGGRIGFFLQRIVLQEEILDEKLPPLGIGANDISSAYAVAGSGSISFTARVNLLLSQCRRILNGKDPILRIQKSIRSPVVNNALSLIQSVGKLPVADVPEQRDVASAELPCALGSRADQIMEIEDATMLQLTSAKVHGKDPSSASYTVNGNNLGQMVHLGPPPVNIIANGQPMTLSLDSMVKMNAPQFRRSTPPGNKFYLNRLQDMGHGSLDLDAVVSLPELLHPVESLSRIFIATFTSDILWFLSCCEIPAHLPVTIACHNRERCWSLSPDKRSSVPYSDFPKLVVVYPPFPEVIAFGKDNRKLGIACHHPKLLLLQREDSIRVIVTSANLVAKQWNSVTNTVWWQDFPRTSRPDYLSLFIQISEGAMDQDSKADFAAQLTGFVSSLLVDVPTQAHWITELTKYDFKGAVGHLVASVPGIHSRKAPQVMDSLYFLPGKQCMPQSYGVKTLGSVETSVVGLSHHFHAAADSDGAQLKKLASFLRKCSQNENGMSEVVLRRNKNIPADANAVSVLIPSPEELFDGDYVQLGFLPRNVAKWIAPLSDIGLFNFSGYVYPKEVLATALEGNVSRVHLILYVSQGPAFSEISKVIQSEHISALCSLLASLQRSVGLWRLQEVLSRYKWPEHMETDFVFGSSSIGSVNAQFLAAFSAATGKTSLQFSESEESDPDWGCWTASQELRRPSIRIIFPTIERVKNADCGILASRGILCFSEKTWQRLKNVDILHDAVPYPSDRVHHPMHAKVARRRFQSEKDAPSFGWVYCGSHNFSAAAWGRPISSSLEKCAVGSAKTNSILGSRLHICNYELGIIFIVPPLDANGKLENTCPNLDDVKLPFVVPAPKYGPSDRPATAWAMREALTERGAREREIIMEAANPGEIEEEILDEEEEAVEATNYVAEEQEEDKAYAEKLWSQVDSSQNC